MSAIAQQKVLVKEGLFQFITKHIPSADINVIDDIVLTYVISILEEASQDPCFDVEGEKCNLNRFLMYSYPYFGLELIFHLELCHNIVVFK